MGRSLKSSDVYARRNQEYFEGTSKDSSGQRSERKEESWRESLHFLRESTDNHAQNVSRNTNVQAHSFKVLRKKYNMYLNNGEKVIIVKKWQKKPTKNLTELYLCSKVLWRIKLGINKIGYLTGGDF